MTIARRQLIDADSTPYYHIISRCVRRAFLCGQDKLTGKDYSHRRTWIEDKLFKLASIFSIDIASYAIMHNHYHLVLHIDKQTSQSWSITQVFEQYVQLHFIPVIVQNFLSNHAQSTAELNAVYQLADEYRERLSSISWFMRCLNQGIARKANLEDKVTGHFWQNRFKSQALLDEAALFTCMAYVDLNPIRAGITDKPETSDFTSIQARITQTKPISKTLLPFTKANSEFNQSHLHITQAAYFQLVDWTGRCIVSKKKGAIPSHIAPILERINLTEHQWLRHTQFYEARFKHVAGTWDSIKRAAIHFGKSWLQGKPKTPLPD